MENKEEVLLVKYEEKDFAGHVIRQRTTDGYLSATDMCKAGGKKFNDWYRLNTTNEFLEELSLALGKPIKELLEVRRGAKGTWVHPRVAINLAIWLSPKFVVKVSGWIEQWSLLSKENENELITALNNLEVSECRLKELELKKRYKEKLGGLDEVKTLVGYIDLLTNTDLIEIKTASNWKHGIGQLICYGEFYINHKLKLLLFDHEYMDNTDRTLINTICVKHNIICEFI